MMRALAFVMSLAMTGATFAQGAPSAKVVEYGIVKSVDGKFVFDKKTKRIPLRRDLRFGFCAEIVGLGADGKHTLAEVVRHPVLVQPNGVETNGWNVPRMVTVENGVARWCASHRFEHDWELVPGKWRFVVGDGERDLVVQEFDAVRGK